MKICQILAETMDKLKNLAINFFYSKLILTVITLRTVCLSFFLGLLFRLSFDLPLQLFHLRPLILKPDLNHSNAESRLFGQGLSDFSAGLGGYLEGRLELSTLHRREDRSRPFGAASAIPGAAVVQVVIWKFTKNSFKKYFNQNFMFFLLNSSKNYKKVNCKKKPTFCDFINFWHYLPKPNRGESPNRIQS